MPNITIRYQQIGDAKRFYEILNHPDFVLFPAKPGSIEEEKRYLRAGKERKKKNLEHCFTILLNGEVAGAVGVKIDQHRTYIGEIGYFVDRKYWGQGVAPQAVALLEKICFETLGLERIELVTLTQNKGSIRVAEKCGYEKEGVQRHKIVHEEQWCDALLFAKVNS
ncbi:MAG: GNAT family N-acetyltransferase [Acidobacteria bacterium]|nr:MAG: GNAT family N-acetyltransferase [Acidobacteriota bacterium]